MYYVRPTKFLQTEQKCKSDMLDLAYKILYSTKINMTLEASKKRFSQKLPPECSLDVQKCPASNRNSEWILITMK